jgi:hypothetical protein
VPLKRRASKQEPVPLIWRLLGVPRFEEAHLAAWRAQGGRKAHELELGLEAALPEPNVLLLACPDGDLEWMADRLDRLAGIDSSQKDNRCVV